MQLKKMAIFFLAGVTFFLFVPALGFSLAPLSAAPRQDGQLPKAPHPTASPLYNPNEVVVKWKSKLHDKTAEQKLDATLQKYAKTKLRRAAPHVLRDHPKRNFSIISSLRLTAEELIEQFSKLPTVEYAHENIIFRAQTQTTPWGIDATSGVNATTAHTQGYTGSGVVVAVVDTGVDYAHEDLAANMWTPAGGDCYLNGALAAGGCPHSGYDFVNDDTDPNDDNGHGTHASGIIAAANNSVGVLGVAPAAKIMAVKTLDDEGGGDYGTVMEGIDFAIDNGADVINLSLGAMNAGVVLKDMQDALDEAETQGIVVVAAAGNSTSAVAFVPAMFSSVISVGAIQETATLDNPDDDYQTRLSYFSNFGKINVVAPGTNMYSTLMLGAHLSDDCNDDDNNGYGYCSGTSMAGPHVAGVVALLKSKDSTLSPAQLRYILETTATDLGAAGKDEFFGGGLVNAATALNNTPTSVSKTVLLEANWSQNRSDAYNASYYYEPQIFSASLPADNATSTTLRVRAATPNGAPLANEQISVTTTAGTITTSSPLTTDANGLAEFSLQAPATAGTATVTATMNSGGVASSVILTFADTLVVADAGQPTEAGNEGWFYTQALTMAGQYWKLSTAAFPSTEETLASYDRVLWFTGRQSINADEQEIIKNYLDGSGRIFVSGGDILYSYYYFSTYGGVGSASLAVDTIFSDYLKVGYGHYIPTTLMLVGDGDFEGTGAPLADLGSVNDNFGYSDVVEALAGGEMQGYFCSNEESALVTVDSTYRSVFLGVSLDAVEKNNREELVQNSLNFLNGAAASGGTFSVPTACDSATLLDDGTGADPSDNPSSASQDEEPVPGLPNDTPELGDPVINNVVVTGRTTTSVTLTWEVAAEIASSVIYAKNAETDQTEAMSTGQTTSGEITGLQPHTIYNFSVYGIYANGTYTAAGMASEITLPPAPAKPVLTAKTKNSITVELADAYETGLQFVVDLQNKKGELLENGALEVDEKSVTFNDLKPNTKYKISARLGYEDADRDEEVYSDYSPTLSVTTYTDQVATPVVKKIQENQVRLKWFKPPSGKIKFYVVQIDQKVNKKYKLLTTIKVRAKLGRQTKTKILNNLVADTNYRVRIRAKYKDKTFGDWSPYYKFKTKS